MTNKEINVIEVQVETKGIAKTIGDLKKAEKAQESLKKRMSSPYNPGMRSGARSSKDRPNFGKGSFGRGLSPATDISRLQNIRNQFESKNWGIERGELNADTSEGAQKKVQDILEKRMEIFKKASDGFSKNFKKNGALVAHGFNRLGRSTVRTIGELTMFTGLLMMFTRTITKLVGNLIKLGDSFAKAEKQFFVGAAFRERLNKKEVKAFDESVQHRSGLTGENKYQASQSLARLGSELRANGGSFNGGTLKDFNEAMVGASAMTGMDNEKISATLLNVARTGKGSEKLGVGQLKLTNNINRNISMIATAVRGNSIGRTAIKKGTIGSSMQQIKSSFGNLFGNVIKGHSKQIREMFKRVGKVFTDVSNDPEVIHKWSRVISNLEEAMDSVFTKDNVKAVALGAAQWAAEAIALAQRFLEFAGYVARNSDTVLNAIDWFVKIYGFWKVANIAAGLGQIAIGTGKIVKAGIDLFKGFKGVAAVAEGLETSSLAFKLGSGISSMVTAGVNSGVVMFGAAGSILAAGIMGMYKKFKENITIGEDGTWNTSEKAKEDALRKSKLHGNRKASKKESNSNRAISNAKRRIEQHMKRLSTINSKDPEYKRITGLIEKEREMLTRLGATTEELKKTDESRKQSVKSLDKNSEEIKANTEAMNARAIENEKKVKNEEVPTVWGNPNAKVITVLGDLTISPSVNTVMGDYGLQNSATAL